MTGPEHFRESERLLKQADDLDTTDAPTVLAAAQVHATLALAAATADATSVHRSVETDDIDTAWAQVTA